MKKFILLSALLAMTLALYAQRVTITRETFGDQAYDTDGPGGGGGFATHYKASAVTTFTSENGTIRGGLSDNSIRMINYGDFGTPSHPDASNSIKAFLAHPTRYSGSWDTLFFHGINIENFTDFKLDLAWSKRPGQDNVSPANVSLRVKVRIDSGSWILLDTTQLTQGLAAGTFAFNSLDIDGVVSGSTMDIVFSTVKYQVVVDDITLTGTTLPPREPIAKETFGTQAYDTDGPGGGGGFATHYKASTAVATFTSENGTIVGGGSDNSVRIINYGDFGTPSYAGASNSMKAFLAHPTRYSGSWDTLIYSNIDIEGFYDFQVRFGMSKRPGQDNVSAANASLRVTVRVDDGPWVLLDTTQLPQGLPAGTFAFAQLNMPSNLDGDEMDILFSTVKYQIVVDDIELMGRSTTPFVYPTDIMVLSAEGNTTGLVIDEEEETMEFQAILFPSNASLGTYTWSVTDETIGSITAFGELIPRKNGDIGVIATADALNADGGAVADTIWVTIENQILPVESITIEALDTTLVTGFGQTVQFIATVLPEDATDRSVTWSLTDSTGEASNYGSIDANGLFTGGFRSIDTLFVTATTVDGGFTDTKVVTITLPVVAAENLSDVDVKIHPNAVTNVVNVEGERIYEVHMINLQGSVVRSVENVKKKKKVSVDVSGVSSGFYLMKVNTLDGKVVTKKIEKK